MACIVSLSLICFVFFVVKLYLLEVYEEFLVLRPREDVLSFTG